jgi:hypothetical protein
MACCFDDVQGESHEGYGLAIAIRGLSRFKGFLWSLNFCQVSLNQRKSCQGTWVAMGDFEPAKEEV